MSSSALLRRAALLIARALGRRASYHSAALSRPLLLGSIASPELRHGSGAGSFAPVRSFAAEAEPKAARDMHVIRAIDAEIECAEQEDSQEDIELPQKFPFDIVDENGTGVAILKRKFHGEDIEVIVSMPNIVTGDEDEEEGDDNDEDNDDKQKEGDEDSESAQSSLSLDVKVSKDGGLSLEFECTAYADEIVIENLCVRAPETDDDLAYGGPDFSDLDENLQKAFHKYLEIRGISPATTNFLHEYMINKDAREYKLWLNDLKKFIQK